MRKPFNAPQDSKRLFDLIKFKNDDYKAAFYFALKDTLVCRDIETASRIAYGQ
jgi:structural maintenance of chromosome 4